MRNTKLLSEQEHEWSVIQHDQKGSPIKEAMKFLDSKHNCQGFFLQLGVMPFSRGESSRNVCDWSILFILHHMGENSSYPTLRNITG